MVGFVERHLDSNQVGRVVYGAIIGLALVVALDAHPPKAGVVVATLLGTSVAVGLAEVYSDTLGTEVRTRRRVDRAHRRAIWTDTLAVAFGISFPALFFLLATAGGVELHTPLHPAHWWGAALSALYVLAPSRP